MSVPLCRDRTTRARAVGSGQTGLVITCPLSGTVKEETLAQTASSGAEGSSPSRKWDRMVIPSELTRGMPHPASTLAITKRPAKNTSRRGRDWLRFVIRTMQLIRSSTVAVGMTADYHKTGRET